MTPPLLAVSHLPASKLHENEGNRPHGSGKEDLKGLAATIRHLGIIVPIVVRPHPRRDGHFVIVEGHRRYRAGQMANLTEFPVMLRRVSPAEAKFGPVLTEIVTNTQRVPWGPVEFAIKLGQLVDGGMSQADIAFYTGLSAQTISYHMELLALDAETLQRVRSGQISVGAAHDAVKAVRAAAPQLSSRPVEIRPRRQNITPGPRLKPRPHFDATHPLAAAAAAVCKTHTHPASQRLNRVACGAAWEAAIRADQDRKHQAQPARDPGPEAAPAPASTFLAAQYA